MELDKALVTALMGRGSSYPSNRSMGKILFELKKNSDKSIELLKSISKNISKKETTAKVTSSNNFEKKLSDLIVLFKSQQDPKRKRTEQGIEEEDLLVRNVDLQEEQKDHLEGIKKLLEKMVENTASTAEHMDILVNKRLEELKGKIIKGEGSSFSLLKMLGLGGAGGYVSNLLKGVGLRTLARPAGALAGAAGLYYSSKGIRERKGESFWGQGAGEGGILKSRAGGYLGAIASGVGTGYSLGGPIGAAIGAITGLGTALVSDNWDSIAPVLESAKNSLEKIWRMIPSSFEKLGVWFSNFTDHIDIGITNLINYLSSGGLIKDLESFGETAKEWIINASHYLRYDLWRDVGSWMGKQFSALADYINSGQAAADVVTIAKDFSSAMANWFGKMFWSFASKFPGLTSLMPKSFKEKWGITEEIENVNKTAQSAREELSQGKMRTIDNKSTGTLSENKVQSYFENQGWSPAQAAAIAAQVKAESNFNPTAKGDSGLAYGLLQWHPARQKEFEKFSGKSIKESSPEEQLAFIQHELTKGGESAAGAKLRGITDAGEAAAMLSRTYVRPKDAEGEAYRRGLLATQIASSTGNYEHAIPAKAAPIIIPTTSTPSGNAIGQINSGAAHTVLDSPLSIDDLGLGMVNVYNFI